jgi:pimeloyl-ACP methyl ester carboxylesterase
MHGQAQVTGTLKTGDVELFFRRFGQKGKTPLLILHGLSYFSYDWIDIAAGLAADREVVAMDMRGFGDSSWSPSKKYGVPDFAGDIIAMLDHLGWPKAVLVGHSMGGRNCTWCAAENPGRVVGLALVDYSPTNSPAGSQRVTKSVADMPDSFPTLDAALAYFKVKIDGPNGTKKRARLEAYLKKVPDGLAVKRDTFFRDRFRKALETGQAAGAGVDMWDAMKRVACPVLVLRGKKSDMFAPETADKVKATNPRIQLVEIDGGHNIPGDNPDGLVREIGGFLKVKGL